MILSIPNHISHSYTDNHHHTHNLKTTHLYNQTQPPNYNHSEHPQLSHSQQNSACQSNASSRNNQKTNGQTKNSSKSAPLQTVPQLPTQTDLHQKFPNTRCWSRLIPIGGRKSHVCVCCVCVCPCNHSYVFGFGCNRNVFCNVVSSVGMRCIILSYVVCIYVSFNVG